ncbi:MAG TPA: SpoIIE family protein phosphatase, partial [Solirubrobacteraceae bacterium]
RHQAEETLRDSAETARRGRARSELVTSVMRDLEAIDRLPALAERLVTTLVPRVADYALLEIPGRLEPVLALAHRDPHKGEILRTLRDEHRIMASVNSVARAAAGESRLIEQVDDEMLRRLAAGSSAVLSLLEQLGPRSHIAVPIDVGGEAGALLLGLSDPERRRYGSEEFALAEEIAYRVSILFAHARVREEEHAIGVRLQQALLPEALFDHPAVQVAARYQTGSDLLYVGGDWYDTLPLPDGRLALTVGDVVGHGLDAAASMSRMRIALAALAPQAAGPGELLSRLAEFSAGANGVQFATATCSFLDPGTGELSYSSAGHPPALVVSPDGASRWLEGGRSMPVGAVAIACDRPDELDRLNPGDLLILYSDGLVERRREPIGMGLARLEAAARAAVDLPVEDLCQRLVTQLAAVSTNDDDAVIMCLRFSPVTLSAFRRRIPAQPDQLAPTRAAIRAWLRRREDPAAVGHRLLLAVGEALTNAVEHAYLGRVAGAVDLSIDADGGDLMRVRVRDHGRWREAASAPGRGHGLKVIQGLASGLKRESDDAGTTVSFELAIPESDE